MRLRTLIILISLISFASPTHASTQTINTLPSSNSTFITDLQTFLRGENADRDRRGGWGVMTGGIGATDASLTHTISAVTAFPDGYFVYQAADSHTYTATKRTFVYVRKDSAVTVAITGAAITYSTNLVFAEMAAATEQPMTPAGVAPLFYADTDGTSITSVVDLRSGRVSLAYWDTLGDALTALGTSNRVTLIVPERYPIATATDASTYENITFDFTIAQGSFSPVSGVTCTFAAPENIIAGKRQRIKHGSGVFAFSKSGKIPVDWFGTNISPGTTDMTLAIEAADAYGQAYFNNDAYGVKNCDITHPAIFNGSELVVLSGSTYGVYSKGDMRPETGAAGAAGQMTGGRVEIDMTGCTSAIGWQHGGRMWSMPELYIEGDATDYLIHDNVGLKLVTHTDYPTTHNRFPMVHIRRIATQVYYYASTASKYINTNTFVKAYLTSSQYAIKFETLTGATGLMYDQWQDLYIEGWDDTTGAAFYCTGTSTGNNPRRMTFNVHFDYAASDSRTFIKVDGSVTPDSNTLVYRYDDFSFYDPNPDGSLRYSGTVSGFHEKRPNVGPTDSPQFSNLRLESSTNRDGVKVGIPGTLSTGKSITFGYVPPLDLTDAIPTYQWTAATGPNEFYCELSGGGDPGLTEPDALYIDNAIGTKGTVGALDTAGVSTWGWGDGGGGFNTVVVSLVDDSDPDTQGAGFITYPTDFTDDPAMAFGFQVGADKEIDYAYIGRLYTSYWLRASSTEGFRLGLPLVLASVVTNLAAPGTFTVSNGNLMIRNNTSGGSTTLTPSGTFTVGHTVILIESGGAQPIVFDPTDLNSTIAAGKMGMFFFSGVSWYGSQIN